MSGDVLVRVEGVSKKFCRDLKRSLWYGLKDTAADLLGRNGASSLRLDEFWAVDGVSFELRRGDCLGLIGRNGAGKTTLLKMLNGLMKPDKGRIEIRGRVGALISLGAGFNPILTGRENIYVNGSVLGLPTREIDAKLDEIVDFAEIGEFIDSPVQSYSAGMQVRLGFAVATALRPDVLLLDEVLAVGDAAFRAKCYDRLARHPRRGGVRAGQSRHGSNRACLFARARAGSWRRTLSRRRGRRDSPLPGTLASTQSLRRPTSRRRSDTVASIVWCDETVGLDGLFNFSVSLQLTQPVPVADVRVVLWCDDGLPALDAYYEDAGLVCASGGRDSAS